MNKRLIEAVKLTTISSVPLSITTFIIFGEPIWPGIVGGMIGVFIMSYYISPKKYERNT